MGEGNDRQSTEDAYLDAAEQLAQARVRYAKEWQWQRSKSNSDQSATQATIESTNDEITILEANMKAFGWRLQNERES